MAAAVNALPLALPFETADALEVMWRQCKVMKGKERKGKERKGKERKGKERKEKERKGKER
jgi:hypothetical protein